MESSAYPMLFSPIKVGTTEVKNRVFMPPVSTNLADLYIKAGAVKEASRYDAVERLSSCLR